MSQPSTPKPHIAVDDYAQMPHPMSTIAEQTDQAYYFTLWFCIGFFILVVGAMIYFAIKYKRKSDDERTSPVDHNFKLEVIWSFVPSALLVVLFWMGLRGYANA